MRTAILAACLGLVVAGCSSVAPTEGLPDKPWTHCPAVVPFMKIARGTTNVVLSPFDVPATIVRVSRDYDNFGYALVAGSTEGVGNCLVRLLAGGTEILTFPIVNDPYPLYERDLGERAYHKPPEVVP